MPIRADSPLRRTTLNLYAADADAMAAYYGPDWTVRIRDLVHDHIRTATAHSKVRRTLGDLLNATPSTASAGGNPDNE